MNGRVSPLNLDLYNDIYDHTKWIYNTIYLKKMIFFVNLPCVRGLKILGAGGVNFGPGLKCPTFILVSKYIYLYRV